MKRFLLAIFAATLLLTACGAQTSTATPNGEKTLSYQDLQSLGLYEFAYADQVSAEQFAGGYWQLCMTDGNKYFVVPEDAKVPADLPNDCIVLQQPLENIYLVSSAAGDFFRALAATDAIAFSGIEEKNWYITELQSAMANGSIAYAGKYSAPDYELLFSKNSGVAIQNTMIYHNPEVKEQLEKLGIPCFVDVSSYESHPLGRVEWMKVYGILLGKLDLAEELFNAQLAEIEDVMQQEATGKTVAFFSVNSNGSFTVRKSNDYVAATISLAGGRYIFPDLGDDTALGTVNMQAESFYAGAIDADVLIYNSTIAGELATMDELLQQAPILADFKAVQSGNVWCTGKNLFQQSTGMGQLILDIHAVLANNGEDCVFLHKLS